MRTQLRSAARTAVQRAARFSSSPASPAAETGVVREGVGDHARHPPGTPSQQRRHGEEEGDRRAGRHRNHLPVQP
ncbi:hypothetical protein [Streptomyces sp. NBC_00354]|uniref:hypothetical protein n=1 Tax=Streptomyces sp. NBC_00354 TaxID=2975723 RepID=UPI002E25E520